jgi:hypothetical protein
MCELRKKSRTAEVKPRTIRSTREKHPSNIGRFSVHFVEQGRELGVTVWDSNQLKGSVLTN